MKVLRTGCHAVIIVLAMCRLADAQAIDIDWVQIAGKEIVVHYTLEDTNPIHAYTVNLFSSKDNFAAPLVKLSGDHGNEIKAGKDRQIRWRITEELGDYKGGIELEVRAKMYVPFLNMASFTTKKSYKRGRNYPLVWRSGNPGGHVDIELYHGDTRIQSDRNVPNTGKFDWQIPATAKPAGGYRLKFTNTKSREETYLTPSFRIANKMPRLVKIAVGGVAAAALAFVLSGGGGEEDPILPPAEEVGSPNN